MIKSIIIYEIFKLCVKIIAKIYIYIQHLKLKDLLVSIDEKYFLTNLT